MVETREVTISGGRTAVQEKRGSSWVNIEIKEAPTSPEPAKEEPKYEVIPVEPKAEIKTVEPKAQYVIIEREHGPSEVRLGEGHPLMQPKPTEAPKEEKKPSLVTPFKPKGISDIAWAREQLAGKSELTELMKAEKVQYTLRREREMLEALPVGTPIVMGEVGKEQSMSREAALEEIKKHEETVLQYLKGLAPEKYIEGYVRTKGKYEVPKPLTEREKFMTHFASKEEVMQMDLPTELKSPLAYIAGIGTAAAGTYYSFVEFGKKKWGQAVRGEWAEVAKTPLEMIESTAKWIVSIPSRPWYETLGQAGAMYTTGGAMKTLFVKFPKIKYTAEVLPTATGKVPLWKGLYVELGKRTSFLIGKDPKGWVLGKPRPFYYYSLMARGEMIPFKTPIRAKILQTVIKTAKEEVTMKKSLENLARGLKDVEAKIIREFPTKTATLTAKELLVYEKWARKWKTQTFGSTVIEMQLPKKMKLGRLVHDIDVQLKTKRPELVDVAVKELVADLKRAGSRVEISPMKPTLLVKKVKGVKEPVHAFDIKYVGEGAKGVSPSSEMVLGITLKRKVAYAPEVGEIMGLSEMFLRKVSSVLELRKEGLGPALHRMKDVADVPVIGKGLIYWRGQTLKGRLTPFKTLAMTKTLETFLKELPPRLKQVIAEAEGKPLKIKVPIEISKTGKILPKGIKPKPTPLKVSPSTYPPVSVAPSIPVSVAPSPSPSISPAISSAVSSYISAKPSVSPSITPYVSPSVAPKLSRPSYPSKVRHSPSLSPSLKSLSPYPSPSVSPSPSPSLSPSPSPSITTIPRPAPSPIIYHPSKVSKYISKGNPITKGYHAYMRRFGKFVRVTKAPRVKTAALGKGALAVHKTAGATFFIKEAGRVRRPRGFVKKFPKKKFYTKAEKGKLLYIEKPKYRIETIGEKREIPYKGQQVLREKARKKAIKRFFGG